MPVFRDVHGRLYRIPAAELEAFAIESEGNERLTGAEIESSESAYVWQDESQDASVSAQDQPVQAAGYLWSDEEKAPAAQAAGYLWSDEDAAPAVQAAGYLWPDDAGYLWPDSAGDETAIPTAVC